MGLKKITHLEGNGTSPVLFWPKTHNVNLIMKKHQRNPD